MLCAEQNTLIITVRGLATVSADAIIDISTCSSSQFPSTAFSSLDVQLQLLLCVSRSHLHTNYQLLIVVFI